MIPQLIPYRKKDKWGFCSPDGEIVIECIYDEVSEFSKNGRAEVKLKGSKECISKEGEILSINNIVDDPAKYIYWDPFNDQPSAYEYKYVYFDSETHRILSPSNMPKNYDESNLAPIQRNIQINDNYAYINSKGKLILPFIYQYADFFYEGLAHVVTQDGSGFINEKGEFIIAPCDDREYGKFSEELAYVVTENGFGFINKKGEIVIPCTFLSPGNFSEGLAGVRLNRWGYINKGGMFVIPDIYDEVYDFKEGFGKVKLNKQYGYFNKDGVLAIPCIYDEADSFKDGIAKVKVNNKWGYINMQGVQYWND